MTQKLAAQKSIRLILQKHLFATTAMTVASVLASTSAYAVDVNETPTGGVVVGGSSTISYSGSNNQNLNVLQTTQQSVINWNSFNLGKDASATYVQPNANSLSVNRVTGAGNDPSKIYGTLSSNGRIMILDANGVLFGASAKVDVGGIIATTGTLDADNQNKLLAGQGFTINNIDKNAESKIENQGVINVADGGLAAFVAPWVANSGAINAKLGSVTLAAGQKLTVDLAGDSLISIAVTDKLEKALVENSGAIDAAGGNVTISANAAKGLVDEVINMSGVIKANSFSQKGGKIVLSGGGGKVKVTGKLDASGKTGGGSIDVRGQDIDVGVGAELNADATSTGNGGSAIVFANNTAIINGRLSAKGGALSGNGGFIETSGFNLGVSELASVNASAANGLAGTWLLDPLSIVISNGSGATTNVDGRDYTNVNAGGLSAALSGGTNVTVETGVNSAWSLLAGQFLAADDNEGDIRVRSNITHSGSAASTLTLIAHDDISIENGADITATGTGALGVNLQAKGDGLLTFGDINVAAGSVISTKGGAVTFKAENDITIDEDITTAGGNIALTAGGKLTVQSGDDVDAGTGNLTVNTDALTLNGALKGKAVNISRATFDGRISLGAGNGGLEISNAELGRITTDTLTIGTTGTTSDDNDIYVDGANLSSFKTTNLNTMRNDSGSNENVTFAGATTAQALNVNADDDISFKKNASLTTTGNVVLNANTNNLSDGDLYLGVNAKIDTNGKNLTSTALNTVLDSGAKIDAEGGNVSLYNTRLFKSNDANSVNTKGTGTITLNQNNGGSIQNAIDAVNNTGSGLNTINVGAGTYHESVRVYENNFLLNGKNAGVAGNGTRGAESVIDGDGTSNFGIKITSDNVAVDGFEVKNITGNGIHLQGGTDKITLANNYIHNIKGDGIYAIDLTNGVIKRNKITDITSTANLNGSGIQVIYAYNSVIGGDTTADANTISNTGWDGVRIEGGGYLNVKNNNIKDVTRSGIFAGAVSSFTLANNIINGTKTHYGIDVSNGWDATVTGNDIDNTTLDGISMYGTGLRAAAANVISGNHVDGSKASGITVNSVTKPAIVSGNFVGLDGGVDNIAANGIQVLSSTGVVVKGNQVTETKGNGIYTNASIDSQIGGALPTDANTVYDINANGISINGGSGNKVTGNDVSDTTQDGIALNTTANATVSGNIVHDLAGRGIYATGLSKNANGESFISGNYVDNTGSNGIHLDGSNKYVNINGNFIGTGKGSTISGDGIYGMNLENSVIKGNTITNTVHTAGNNGSGVQLIYAYNTVIGGASSTDADANHIYGTGWDGVRVEGGGNLTVQGNDISDVTRTGVFGGNVDKLTVNNNVINGAQEKYGIDISGGWNVSVTNNNIDNTFLDGISMYGVSLRSAGTNTISGNHVDTTGASGIVVNNVVSGVVTGNFVGLEGGEDNIGVDGVQVLSSSGTVVTGNQITNTLRNGIYTNAGSSLQIGGYNDGELNTISYAGANGISVNGGSNNNIVKNDVRFSTADGIYAAASNNLLIDDNEVHNSGDDGIDVRDAVGNIIAARNSFEGENEETPNDEEATVYNVNIVNNNVSNSHNHGINVNNSDSVNVYNNDVNSSGHYTDGWWPTGNGINAYNVSNLNIDTNRIYNSQDSGIVVNNGGNTDITGNTVQSSGYDGIYAYGVYNLSISGNGVTGGNSNGIEVGQSDGAQILGNTVNDFYNGIRVYSYGSEVTRQDGSLVTLISGNFIGLTPTKEPIEGGILTREDSTITSITNDGIQVEGLENVDIINNEVRNFGGDGIEVSYSGNVLIDQNHIFGGEGTTGIRLGSGFNFGNDNNEGCGELDRCSQPKFFAVELDNDETTGDFQVVVNQFSGNGQVTITNNTVDDNFVGIDAQAANNGGIVLAGNTLTNNTIGGWISSGHIDLTGASNTFNGGHTALRFQAYTQPVPNDDDCGPMGACGDQGSGGEYVKTMYQGDYTDLTLEGETLGTTIFNGQSTYYVELLNGSFFNPGTPTVIDGRFASFDGFVPGTKTIDATKLAAIEAMINDYDDNKTLGQIFVGLSPADLDDNDIMKKIFGNNYKPGKGSITILGLPTTTSAPGTFTEQELANIAPAAGGNDNTPANVEPAAGEASDGCWSAVTGTGGPTVNMSMSEEPSDVLAAQNACGGTDI